MYVQSAVPMLHKKSTQQAPFVPQPALLYVLMGLPLHPLPGRHMPVLTEDLASTCRYVSVSVKENPALSQKACIFCQATISASPTSPLDPEQICWEGDGHVQRAPVEQRMGGWIELHAKWVK